MTIHRTAQGKSIDMGVLMKKNETVRAVSNLSLNARGDTIDANGKVIESVTDKVGKKYKQSVELSEAEREIEADAGQRTKGKK
jgi:uncharacterized membrane protein YukC